MTGRISVTALLAGLAFLVLGCGGGGAPASTTTSNQSVGTPSIQSFTTSTPSISLGQQPELEAVFTNGLGSVEGFGTVQSGVAFKVPAPTAIGTQTYTLLVYPLGVTDANTSQKVTATVSVAVIDETPVIDSLQAAQTFVDDGGSTTMTATFSGGTGEVDHGVGPVVSGQPFQVTPPVDAATQYTLTVTSPGGAKATKSLTLTAVQLPAISDFTAAPPAVDDGGTTNLLAAFTGGAGSITGIGPILSGVPLQVSPLPSALTKYDLVVTNQAGTSVTASVSVLSSPKPAIQSFTATPAVVTNGKTTQLLGVFSGGTGDIAGVGPVTSGVPVTVTPPPSTQTDYTLTVTSPSGTPITQKVTVTAVKPATINYFVIE